MGWLKDVMEMQIAIEFVKQQKRIADSYEKKNK